MAYTLLSVSGFDKHICTKIDDYLWHMKYKAIYDTIMVGIRQPTIAPRIYSSYFSLLIDNLRCTGSYFLNSYIVSRAYYVWCVGATRDGKSRTYDYIIQGVNKSYNRTIRVTYNDRTTPNHRITVTHNGFELV